MASVRDDELSYATGSDLSTTTSSDESRGVSRRNFIGATTLMAGAAATGGGAVLHDLLAAASRSGTADPAKPKAPPHISLSVEREADLVLLDFFFYDFAVKKTKKNGKELRYLKPLSAKNLIIVQFPPQSIAEAVYSSDNAGTTLPCDPAPILSTVSGRSRLAFILDESDRIDLPSMRPADLLDWNGWRLSVADGAKAHSAKPITAPVAPTSKETAIEAPYGLYLSPVVDVHKSTLKNPAFSTAFRNPVEPLTVNGVSDCWSATLTSAKYHDPAFVPKVAAVWSRDYTGATATPETNIRYGPAS